MLHTSPSSEPAPSVTSVAMCVPPSDLRCDLPPPGSVFDDTFELLMEQTSWWLQRSHLEQTLALHLAVSLDDDSCMTIRTRNLKVAATPPAPSPDGQARRLPRCPPPAPMPTACPKSALVSGTRFPRLPHHHPDRLCRRVCEGRTYRSAL